ncbi:M14 family zinc carboxypeptidase [Massilia sp. TS11]|uniref:M14 family zinc carboxypeptidase n=1 Tax=Massilia sp. TS11 TaxID=2908003 RepID=UPI001EDB71A6|nr:M14 family zinc carboxypeptidase [Massilia sp. TS11]MCG2584810.1 peptidase M14 [Massilia sp. TS11]
MQNLFPTPYELGNQNQTTTWQDCIAWYEDMARRFPGILQLEVIGHSDNGRPIHAGVITADGVFERARLQAQGRPVFFNNNGIHPGEPEGIDACMALVRDFCTQPERLARLGNTVFLFIPVYNVDGSLNRANTSRVNQDGPEAFGFRGCALHLDLNRDFIKCDSRNAQVFNRFFAAWSPDVMVDTHTSNGADYSYTMTLIHTQCDKLGGGLGEFLRATMLPAMFEAMAQRGWPMCPYVNPVQDAPDHGIAEFLETPRFSTGYAALHQTIGFMPETHMLKPFADRYAAMRALVETTLDFTLAHGAQIQALRAAARAEAQARRHWPLHWALDTQRASQFRFKGYAARYSPSKLGNYTRLSYDRSAPWEKDIPYFNRFVADISVDTPRAYLLPQAWRDVIERLEWNGVVCERLNAPRSFSGQAWHVASATPRPGPYEGHMYHEALTLERQPVQVEAQAGDVIVWLDRGAARYAVETLEPQAHDSFFRWGFFNSVLEKKEAYSDYVFEDHAAELLAQEPELAARFADWKAANPDKLSDQRAVLDFIFAHCARYREPEWRRYPVIALFDL